MEPKKRRPLIPEIFHVPVETADGLHLDVVLPEKVRPSEDKDEEDGSGGPVPPLRPMPGKSRRFRPD